MSDGNFHGLELRLRSLPGARAVRVVHPGGQSVGEHDHGWPFITLHVLGGYKEQYDGGEARLAGPSATLHPAGRPHADTMDGEGLETISIEFDPAWLRLAGAPVRLDRSHCRSGGTAAAAGRRLAALWAGAAPPATLAQETARFIRSMQEEAEAFRPRWIDAAEAAVEAEDPPTTERLARRLDLHAAWLARAYRAATGEGLHERLRRRRVERAVCMLRTTLLAPADIAAAAGFCDQSHMNRCFRALIGRTPLEVRAERVALTALAA